MAYFHWVVFIVFLASSVQCAINDKDTNVPHQLWMQSKDEDTKVPHQLWMQSKDEDTKVPHQLWMQSTDEDTKVPHQLWMQSKDEDTKVPHQLWMQSTDEDTNVPHQLRRQSTDEDTNVPHQLWRQSTDIGKLIADVKTIIMSQEQQHQEFQQQMERLREVQEQQQEFQQHMQPVLEFLQPIMQRYSKGCRTTQKGKEYTGTLAETNTKRPCQRWDSNSPHKQPRPASQFPDATLADAANFCRNPSSDSNGPWCYTKDPNTRYEYCNVPLCL